MDVQKYDGFISMREDGAAFAKALVSWMEHNLTIRPAHQQRIGGPDHVKTAQEFIVSTHFTVIVIGPSKLDPPKKNADEPCYQQREIEAALAHYRECKRNEIPYELFFVHLTDTPSEDETDEFRELIGQLKFGIRDPSRYFIAPTETNRRDPRWQETLEKVTHSVKFFMESNGVIPVGEQGPLTGANSKGADRVKFTPEERSYIDRNLPNWLKGNTDQLKLIEGPDAEATRMRHALFEFEPMRCILLDARRLAGAEDGMDETAGDSDDSGNQFDRIPVLRTIFNDDHRALMVTGPAGAGKTTSLTTAAALMAGRASGEFRARIDPLLDTVMGDLVRKLPAPTEYYVPVVIRAASLAFTLGTTRRHPWEDFETLIDFMIGELHEGQVPTEGIDGARAQMRKRLEEQPYAIFIDALDEVLTNSVAVRILSMAKFAYGDFARKERKIKIVLSARQPFSGSDATNDVVLEPLRLDQIDSYLDSFVRSLESVGQPEIERFKKEARNSFDERDSLLEFLSQPFNLNCFCWLAWQDWERNGTISTPRSETEFFRFIINRLIEDLNPEDPQEGDLPKGMLRLLLRRMAYDALNSENGMNSLLVSEAEKLCTHTLSSAYAYLSDEEDYVAIEPEYVRRLLASIAKGTDLLARQGEFYQFPKVRFCEYLAGERIDSDALTTASLQNMRHSKLKQMFPSMRYCYGLRIKRNVASYANNVLNGLLSRADQWIAEDVYENGFDWLNAALECFSSGIDANFTENGDVEIEGEGYFAVRKRALEIISEHGRNISPSRRAETISLLLKLGRRPNHSVTVSKIQTLFENLTQMGIVGRWVNVEIPISDETGAPTREIQVERTPVLVCEYEDFLVNHNDSDDVWGHSDIVNEHRIDCETIPDGEQISPEEIWRNQRRNPGNPVTSVTWYEAVAYAKWMTRKEGDGYEYRLPSEYEVHAISRKLAGDENSYPWGETLSKGMEAQANWRGAEIGSVCPPGTFPALEVQGPNGPVGKLVDFGSNVRIWTLDTADNHAPIWGFNAPVPESQSKLVWGASWIDRKEFFNAMKRGERFNPSIKDPRFGFRLVREPRESK